MMTGVRVEKVENSKKGVAVTLQQGDVLEADKVLVSIGRPLNTQNIGLEKTKWNKIMEFFRTNRTATATRPADAASKKHWTAKQ